mmetsp:Transcript_38511/g.98487  ORF Transcript_38511/g.98487 Transcript_38511/m.98487 type:complete len:208 (+) Transcript_38511:566-1189(+)
MSSKTVVSPRRDARASTCLSIHGRQLQLDVVRILIHQEGFNLLATVRHKVGVLRAGGEFAVLQPVVAQNVHVAFPDSHQAASIFEGGVRDCLGGALVQRKLVLGHVLGGVVLADVLALSVDLVEPDEGVHAGIQLVDLMVAHEPERRAGVAHRPHLLHGLPERVVRAATFRARVVALRALPSTHKLIGNEATLTPGGSTCSASHEER